MLICKELEVRIDVDIFDIADCIIDCSNSELTQLTNTVLGELDTRDMYLEIMADEVTECGEAIADKISDSIKADFAFHLLKNLDKEEIIDVFNDLKVKMGE